MNFYMKFLVKLYFSSLLENILNITGLVIKEILNLNYESVLRFKI